MHRVGAATEKALNTGNEKYSTKLGPLIGVGFINALGEKLLSMGVVVSVAGFSCEDHVSVHSASGWWYRNSNAIIIL